MCWWDACDERARSLFEHRGCHRQLHPALFVSLFSLHFVGFDTIQLFGFSGMCSKNVATSACFVLDVVVFCCLDLMCLFKVCACVVSGARTPVCVSPYCPISKLKIFSNRFAFAFLCNVVVGVTHSRALPIFVTMRKPRTFST